MSPRVIVEDGGGVRVLTLNRPAARNALDGALVSALYEALVDADAAPGVGAVVLTGADPAFCAGIDLKEAARDGAAYFDKHRAQPCIPQVGTAGTIGAALAAERTAAHEQRPDLALLEQRRAAVTERNRRQVRTGP
jgi:enoyl-CoA hydratase/carnithine racemase